MNASAAGKLYTAELLSLATELADYPLAGEWPVTAEARSKTCGSSIRIGIAKDGQGAIDRLGLAVTACAVGQASAAIFARHAAGLHADDILAALREIEAWLLSADAPMPEWPDMDALLAARSYRGRHGAIALAWRAAAEALCKADSSG